VTNPDRLVTAVRRWLEDRLTWYDRAAEQRAMARTEGIRRRSIQARKHREEVQTPARLASYARIRLPR
jgi:hypothetical protein